MKKRNELPDRFAKIFEFFNKCSIVVIVDFSAIFNDRFRFGCVNSSIGWIVSDVIHMIRNWIQNAIVKTIEGIFFGTIGIGLVRFQCDVHFFRFVPWIGQYFFQFIWFDAVVCGI